MTGILFVLMLIWFVFGIYWLSTLIKHIINKNYKPKIRPLMSFTIALICFVFICVISLSRHADNIDENQISTQTKSEKSKSPIFRDIGYQKRGGTVRVFSVFTDSNNFSEMEQYAKHKMWTERIGSTTVFFFDDIKNTPDVTFVGEQFDKKYEKYCIAAYWKYPTGIEKFIKYPFTKK